MLPRTLNLSPFGRVILKYSIGWTSHWRIWTSRAQPTTTFDSVWLNCASKTKKERNLLSNKSTQVHCLSIFNTTELNIWYVHWPFSVTVFLHEIILFFSIDRIMFSSQELWKIASHPSDKNDKESRTKKNFSTFKFYWHAYFII